MFLTDDEQLALEQLWKYQQENEAAGIDEPEKIIGGASGTASARDLFTLLAVKGMIKTKLSQDGSVSWRVTATGRRQATKDWRRSNHNKYSSC